MKTFTKEDQIRAGSRYIMHLMALLEKYHRKMFQDVFPELEDEIWAAIDSKDIIKIRRICARLCNLCDDVQK